MTAHLHRSTLLAGGHRFIVTIDDDQDPERAERILSAAVLQINDKVTSLYRGQQAPARTSELEMSDSHAELERLYLSYEAELAATQANIERCQREANEYRDRFTKLLNDRTEAVQRLCRGGEYRCEMSWICCRL